jgi:hypothetical protein
MSGTGYYVRAENEDGTWGEVDIADLQPHQREQWLETVAANKSEGKWLVVCLEQLCIERLQVKALVTALTDLLALTEDSISVPVVTWNKVIKQAQDTLEKIEGREP